MARRRTRRGSADPLMQRAIAMAQQQYGSQASSILSAIKEAGATKTSSIRQARASAQYNSDAEMAGAKALTAQLGQIGTAAQKNSGYADTLLAQPNATSATGPGSALLAAIGNSRQNVPVNVASQQAEAVRQGNERASRARSGGAFAEQAANVTFEGNVQKLRDQLSGVQNQQGLKASTTYEDLLDKANRDALAGAKFDLDVQKENRVSAADDYKRQHGLGDYKPAKKTGGDGDWTPLQKRDARVTFGKMVGAYQNGIIIQKADKDAGTPAKVWTLGQAKKGILGNGNKVSKTTAVKLYEKRIRDNLTQKLGPRLGNAVAQTVTYGGVGPGTYKAVKKDYGIPLKQFTAAWHAPMAAPKKRR